MPARPVMRRSASLCSRRGFLVAMSAMVGAGLAACSGDASHSPPEPSGDRDQESPRAQAPDLAVLEATLTRTRDLITAGPTDRDDELTRSVLAIRTALVTQEGVLTTMVQVGGGQDGDQGSTSTSPPFDEAATTSDTGRRFDPEEWADALARSSLEEEIQDELSEVTGPNLPTLMSLHGQRVAAARLLGASSTSVSVRGPSGAGAITVLAGLRQAAYGLEVLAARSSADERETYREALSALRGPTRRLTELAGGAAPAPPLGYGLPEALSTRRERRDTAQLLFLALSQSIIAGSSARASDDDAIAGTVALMALSVQVGFSFAVPMAGFPGLDVPKAR
ncbi:MAG: hypothetical protein WBG89_11900 [Ornithinimicrobium sp.]